MPSGHPEFNRCEVDLAASIRAASSFEELVLVLMERYLSVTCGQFIPERSDLLCALVKSSAFLRNSKYPEPIELMVVVPISMLKTAVKWHPISCAIHKLADSYRVTLNESWLEERDTKMRVLVDSWEGQVVAPANSLLPLVLSYATVPMGSVCITNEISELQPQPSADVASLKLQYAPDSEDQMLQETIGVRIDLLQRKVDAMRAKTVKRSSEGGRAEAFSN